MDTKDYFDVGKKFYYCYASTFFNFQIGVFTASYSSGQISGGSSPLGEPGGPLPSSGTPISGGPSH